MTAWRQANSSHNWKVTEDFSRSQLFGHVPVDPLNRTATRAHRQNVTTVQEALELQPRLWRSSLAGLCMC